MVAQQGAVAAERADRALEVDLGEPGLAGIDRATAQHRQPADDIRRPEMEVNRQPVAQRRFGKARRAQLKIEPPRRRMPLGGQEPVAAAGPAALGKRAGDVDRAALAGRSSLDRPVLRVQAAHPRFPADRADQQPLARRQGAGDHGSGHHQTDPGQGEGAVDRHAEEARRRGVGAAAPGDARACLEMRGQRRDPVAAAARCREDRGVRVSGRGQQGADLARHRFDALGLDAVDLGHDRGDLGDPDQFEDVEMLQGLRPRPVIGGDDQQHPVDRQHPRQHVGQKALVAGDIDKAELGPVRQGRIGKAEIDRQPALLLLGQPVGVDPGQRPHQRGLAVVDMAGGGEDHGFGRAEPPREFALSTPRGGTGDLSEEGSLVLEAAHVEQHVAIFDMADNRDR